jgi:hypothetical protein
MCTICNLFFLNVKILFGNRHFLHVSGFTGILYREKSAANLLHRKIEVSKQTEPAVLFPKHAGVVYCV